MARDVIYVAAMTAPGPTTTHTLSRRGRIGRKVLKRWMYAQLAIRDAVMIVLGREQPLVRFTVEADPPSVYVVYELAADERDRFARRPGPAPTGWNSPPSGVSRATSPATC